MAFARNSEWQVRQARCAVLLQTDTQQTGNRSHVGDEIKDCDGHITFLEIRIPARRLIGFWHCLIDVLIEYCTKFFNEGRVNRELQVYEFLSEVPLESRI